jgi:hypothetical protein
MVGVGLGVEVGFGEGIRKGVAVKAELSVGLSCVLVTAVGNWPAVWAGTLS